VIEGKGEKRRREEKEKALKLFHKRGQAARKWHDRALTIDFSKTKLTIMENTAEAKKAPDWAYEKFVEN
jgi:hypothetical protein